MFLIKDNEYVFGFIVFLICLRRPILMEGDALSKNFGWIIVTLGCLRLILGQLTFDLF